MNQRQLEALVKKNAAKAAKASNLKRFGKKYDQNLTDDPVDEASIKERERSEKFFKEMKERDF